MYGMSSSFCWSQLTATFAASRSMVGAWLVTVTVSWSVATCIWPLIVIVAPAFRLTPSILSVLKPVRPKVTLNVPPGSNVKRYVPCSSVTAVRGSPIICGLAIETVTPGSVPPLVSVARPVIVPVRDCANAPDAEQGSNRAASASRRTHPFVHFMFRSS